MSYIGVQPFGQTVRTVTTITATASQTTFSPNGGYTVGYCDVYYNGIKLVEGQDYNASNGTTVVLTTGATANAVVDIVTYGTVTITDAVRRSGDTFAGAVAINSTLAAGNTTITGSLTASANVNLDSGTLFVDGTNNRVGINNTAPTAPLTVTGNTIITGTANVSQGLTANTLTTTANTLTIGTAAYHVANGNFGIGMSSPVYKLEVSSAASGVKINTTVATATNPGLDLLDGSVDAIFSASNSQSAVYIGAYSNHPVIVNTNNTERMRIDSSGRVTIPYQPCFLATRTSGNMTTNGQTVVFNSVQFNTGSHYNSSTGRFTAPITGNYLFTLSAITDLTATQSYLNLYKNNAFYGISIYSGGPSSYYKNLSSSFILNLASGDYIEFIVGTNTGLYAAGDGGNPRFAGCLLN